MSGLITPFPEPTREPTRESARRTGSVVLVLEAVLLVVLGLGALLAPLVAGVLAAGVLGWVLVVAGIAGLVSTLAHRHAVHFAGALLSSLAAFVIGLVIALNPGIGAMVLAFLLAAWLLIDGIASITIALRARETGHLRWWWSLLSGVLDLVLAGVIAFANPLTGIAVVGALIGVDLLIGGVALLGLARGVRRHT